MSANCDVIVIFPIFGQFGAIRKPDSGCIVCKVFILINSNLLSYKNWKQNYKISNTAPTLYLWVKVVFLPKKNTDFFHKKMLTSAKWRGPWYWKVYFLKLHYVYVCTTFQVSSIILTSFRQGIILEPPHPPTSKRNLKKPTQIGVNYVIDHTSICFFFKVNCLHCLLHLLSSDHFTTLASL